MNTLTPNIDPNLPVIRQLDDVASNRIAAGEVVERPASAVKELVENALDARASRIDIAIKDGGKTLIRVTDNGHGIPSEELPMAFARHATSKIDGSDLLNIHTFGFRGEALPSMGAVARITMTSRVGNAEAAQIVVEAGKLLSVRPAALSQGTVVELRDLFFATPARLKFLRTERAETQAISDVIKRLAMAEPYVAFTVRDLSKDDRGRMLFRADAQTGDMFDALGGRLRQILGSEFADNALQIDAEREGICLTGFAALPTYSRGSNVAQFLFVNGRPVRDKLLIGALRGAYSDFLSRDRHPACALFLECPAEQVDVNVHPAKAEVRFRAPGIARGLIVSALKHALAEAGHRASTTVAQATLGAFQPERPKAPFYQMDRPSQNSLRNTYAMQVPQGFGEATPTFDGMSGRIENDVVQEEAAHPLGAARAQVHQNYIIAQTEDGIVIVDGHAAHERLVYERLKRQLNENRVAAQALLIPEIVSLSETEVVRLMDHAKALEALGLVIEPFGSGSVAIRQTPALLGEVNGEAILRDILDEIDDLGQTQTLSDKLEAVLSRVACHGSIRTGRTMRGEEMNALLRDMEATPHSGQCNHGRPTYVELKLADIERLFGRT